MPVPMAVDDKGANLIFVYGSYFVGRKMWRLTIVPMGIEGIQSEETIAHTHVRNPMAPRRDDEDSNSSSRFKNNFESS